jgi:hypothetical protein
MARIWFKLLLPLNLLGIVLIAGVYNLSYDAAYFDRLRHFLLAPENCPAPCFMGIRLGLTTAAGARDTLEANDWVESVEISISALGYGTLQWQWSDDPPDYIDIEQEGLSQISGATIDSLLIRTHIPFAAIWLALGKPERGDVDSVYHIAEYPSKGLAIRTNTTCKDFWQIPAAIFVASWHVTSDFNLHGAYNYPDIRRTACKVR